MTLHNAPPSHGQTIAVAIILAAIILFAVVFFLAFARVLRSERTGGGR